MALSRADVLHIAELADLALTPDEVTQLTRDLGAVLEHVAQLEELDTTNVPLTTHVGVVQMPLRADRVVASLGQDAAVAAAPQANSGAFAVPKFMDE